MYKNTVDTSVYFLKAITEIGSYGHLICSV